MKKKFLFLIPITLFSLASCKLSIPGTRKSGDYSLKYCVEYHDGENVQIKTVSKGDVASPLEDMSKDGYTFAGWYTDIECTKPYDFDTPILKDTILYAKWSESSSPVQFSQLGLEQVNSYIRQECNYTITFECTLNDDTTKNIYFKFAGEGSTKSADRGIAEHNADPDGITWMANNKQYMYLMDNMPGMPESYHYYYMDDSYSATEGYQGIYYFASFFRENLLSSNYWISYNKITQEDYIDSNGKFYYKNAGNNKLQISNDTITLTKFEGSSFNKTFLKDSGYYARIKCIDKIVVTDVCKTRVDLNEDSFAGAISV